MTDGLPVFALIKQVGHKSGRSRFFCTNECHAKSKRYELRLQSQNLSCRVEALGSKTRPLHFSCYEKTSATSHVMKKLLQPREKQNPWHAVHMRKGGRTFPTCAAPLPHMCFCQNGYVVWFGPWHLTCFAQKLFKNAPPPPQKVGNNTNKRGGGIYLSTYICSFFVFPQYPKSIGWNFAMLKACMACIAWQKLCIYKQHMDPQMTLDGVISNHGAQKTCKDPHGVLFEYFCNFGGIMMQNLLGKTLRYVCSFSASRFWKQLQKCRAELQFHAPSARTASTRSIKLMMVRPRKLMSPVPRVKPRRRLSVPRRKRKRKRLLRSWPMPRWLRIMQRPHRLRSLRVPWGVCTSPRPMPKPEKSSSRNWRMRGWIIGMHLRVGILALRNVRCFHRFPFQNWRGAGLCQRIARKTHGLCEI